MSPIIKRLGVIANLQRPGAEAVLLRLTQWCRKHNVPVALCDEMSTSATDSDVVVPRDQLAATSDVILSMGGDGTLLATARLLGDSGVPILGINIGSLGFLTDQTPNDLETTLKRLIEDDYEIQERMVLTAGIADADEEEEYYALNDVVVGRNDIRMINMALYSNGDYICSYAADGLILATPTGSTAYSLAAGGPILNPEMDAIIATPIAPHSLASRPLVFDAGEVLTLEITSHTDVAVMTIDGQVSRRLMKGDRVRVRKAHYYTRLVRFWENSFYHVLRSKLHWGVLPSRDSSSSD
ncbi:MAG: NAD(+)/NADH kinase [Candidatus Zixiibacteriota bacterium]